MNGKLVLEKTKSLLKGFGKSAVKLAEKDIEKKLLE